MSVSIKKSYQVFSSTRESDLSLLVTKALENGYELQGHLIVTRAMFDDENGAFVLVYTQAVLRSMVWG